jgi:hypothetical protein
MTEVTTIGDNTHTHDSGRIVGQPDHPIGIRVPPCGLVSSDASTQKHRQSSDGAQAGDPVVLDVEEWM